MKKQVKNWLRWTAAGAFGLMLGLNVMIGLDFKKDQVVPSLTLTELGNLAQAQGEEEDEGGDASYYQMRDHCRDYYPGCNVRVIKCRYEGTETCWTSLQVPCKEACG